MYFGSSRERLDPSPGNADGPWIDPPLEAQFKENKPDDLDEAEADVVTTLIRSILRYEPSQRPSAEEILKHPWFRE